MIRRRIGVAVLLAGMAWAGAAAAGDLLVTKADVTDLTEGNVGKPFWSLQAQCAGIFGAGYAYETAHQRAREAGEDEAWGVAMLTASIARLQEDRGIDQKAATQVAAQEVEAGRATANKALADSGTSPEGQWNYLRSACVDVSEAYNRLSPSR